MLILQELVKLSFHSAKISMREEDFMEGENLTKKIFSTEEIRACREDGDCAQCGLCCYAFVTLVPEKIPLSEEEQKIATYVKSALEFCQHLRETPEGLFQCDCQKVKAHTLLKDCVGWNGNNQNGKISEYKSMEGAIAERLMSCNQNQLLVINRMVERGIIQFDLLAKNFSLGEMQEFLITILSDCESIPHALLVKMEIKKYFQVYSKGPLKIFLENHGLFLKQLTTKQKILLKVYLPQVYLK